MSNTVRRYARAVSQLRELKGLVDDGRKIYQETVDDVRARLVQVAIEYHTERGMAEDEAIAAAASDAASVKFPNDLPARTAPE